MANARTTKGKVTPATRRWDWTTKDGRDALDAAVLAAVAAGDKRRREVAKRLGIGDSDRALRAVGMGLVRGAARGHLTQSGEGGQREYVMTPKGETVAAAKEGGGRG